MKPCTLCISVIFLALISFILIQCTKDNKEIDPVINPEFNLYKILDGREIRSLIKSSDGGYVGLSGESDYEIVKFDADFNIVWDKTFGGSSLDYAASIVQSDDDGYLVIGYTLSTDGDISLSKGRFDIWACRLDTEGNLVWDKTYGGLGDDIITLEKSLIKTDDGGYIFIGSTSSFDQDTSLLLGVGNIWVVKINSVGVIEFEKTIGGTGNDYGSAIVETDYGYAFVANVASKNENFPEMGAWMISVDRSGNLVWQTCLHGGIAGSLVYSENNEIASVSMVTNNSFLLQILGTDGVIKKNKTLSFFQPTFGWPLGGTDILKASDGGYFIISDVKAGKTVDAHLFRVDDNLGLIYSKTYIGTLNEISCFLLPLRENHYLYGFITSSRDLPDINYMSITASVFIDFNDN